MRAVLYARRSTSDRDERQVQSIADQVRIMTDKGRQEGLSIAEELTESMSAKEPYVRPKFDRMLKLIDSGKVDCILCWHLNRLFRNSVDMAAIQWRLQRGIIRKIVTADRIYLPEDNVLLFYMEAGVSNQTVLDLSKAVKRGMESKVQKGWHPHKAPPGYINDKWKEKGHKTISRDPERFDLVRKAWDLMLTGTYSVPQVQDIMNHQWGYRSLPTKSGGDAPIGRNTLYELFANVFYAGYFVERGEVHEGSHEPMVTVTEFRRVQEILGRDRHTQPQKHDFAYTGLMRCTRCGGLVSAQIATKPSGRIYRYYFCQNRSGRCSRVTIREDALERQIDGALARIGILPEFGEWGRQELEQWRRREPLVADAVRRQQGETLGAIDRQLDSLLTLKLKELVTDEEYAERKAKLHNERSLLRQQAQEADEADALAREAVENLMTFTGNVRAWFAGGDIATRRAIARALGSNYRFTEGKVEIELHPLLQPVQEEYEQLEAKYRKIKLDKNSYESQKEEALEPLRPAWSRILDNIRLLALNNSLSFPNVQESVEVSIGVHPKKRTGPDGSRAFNGLE